MTPLSFPKFTDDIYMSIDLRGKSEQETEQGLTTLFSTAEKYHLSHVHIISDNDHQRYSELFYKTVSIPQFLERPEIKKRIRDIHHDVSGHVIIFKRKARFYQNLEILQQIAQTNISLDTFSCGLHLNTRSAEEDREAQFELYFYYLNAPGANRNPKMALYWLEKAANNDHQTAQSILGFEYALGRYVEKNHIKAMHWHKKAANAHRFPNKNSLFWIGSRYWLGIGVLKDDKVAIQYLSRAAYYNHKHAALNLGRILIEGDEDTPIDFEKGFKNLFIAAEGELIEAQIILAQHYFFGWNIDVNYKLALHWFSKASSDPLAQYYIGRIHLEGLGVIKNIEIAYDAFQKSGDFGVKWLREVINLKEDGEALYLLFRLLQCHDEQTTMEDFVLRKEIIDCLTRAAKLKFMLAQETLAFYYLDGYLVQQNQEIGITLLEEAVLNGSTKAMLELDLCYKNEVGINSHSIEFLNKVAESPNIEIARVAEYWLACIYFRPHPEGGEDLRDMKKTLYWLKRSLKHENKDALPLFREWMKIKNTNEHIENPIKKEDDDEKPLKSTWGSSMWEQCTIV